jgi:EAL domain-containing protein (putative c-di-GMP-specific phosphodiesterase class I)
VASPTFGTFLKSLLRALHNYVKEGIIAEGVELDKELEVVKQMGIFKVQGYLLGRPDELKSTRHTDPSHRT